jgi:hypothetical protein
MTEPPLTNPFGEISEAAREKARTLRILRYRMLFIFLLLPSLLVMAIVFDWIWELSLSGRMTRDTLIAIYGGLIAAFVLVFLVLGYVIRKRMRHEEEEALKGPVPVEMTPRATSQPIPMPTDRKSQR